MKACLSCRVFGALLALGIVLPIPLVTAQQERVDRGEDSADYQERLARFRALGHHRLSEGLRRRAIYKTRRAAMEAEGFRPEDIREELDGMKIFSFPFHIDLPLESYGPRKTLTILIDFADHRAGPNTPTLESIAMNIYGEGTEIAKRHIPLESLRNYYSRASEGKLDVQGEVFGWHEFGKTQKEYEPLKGSEDEQPYLDSAAMLYLAEEVLAKLDADHDFSKYDNDGDGDIDCVTIIHAGCKGEWNSFWWPKQTEFAEPEGGWRLFDGKHLGAYVIQSADVREGNDFDPRTLIHETGHVLGLPDYYDYDPCIGPDGAIGGWDMMDGEYGNHCAFSRWLLDWIEPVVVGKGAPKERQLLASGATAGKGSKAYAVFPGLKTGDGASGEMFLLENRQKVGNDFFGEGEKDYGVGPGLLIWHIDATVDVIDEFGTEYFLRDNSYTDVKLIRLMRANTPEDFANGEWAFGEAAFNKGNQFTPDSSPSSARHDRSPTGVSVTGIEKVNDVTMAARIGFVPVLAPPLLAGSKALEDGQVPPPAPSSDVDLDQLEALDRELNQASVEEVQRRWGEIAAVLPGRSRERELLEKKMILAHWAAKAGEPAVAALLASGDHRLAKEAFPLLMQSWAANRPRQAADWYFHPDRSVLRESKELIAGDVFVERVFAASTRAGFDERVAAIDLLRDVAEVNGALRGIEVAGKRFGIGKGAIGNKLEGLKKNRAVVDRLIQLRRSIDDLEIEKLRDPGQAEDFQEFLRDGISD